SQTPGKTIAQILLTMNAASEGQMLSALAEQLGLKFETPEKSAVDPKAFELLQPDYIRKNFVLPVRFEGYTLIVAMSDPNNVFLIDEVRRKTKRSVKTVVTPTADINRVVELLT